jgi:acyl dehydratase
MAAVITFDSIREGDAIEPLVKGEITKPMLVEYGDAALDGNPIHTDDEFARDSGYPGVFAQGMLSMGFLGQFLVDRFGPEALKRFKVRFSKITWPGETITCRAACTRKYIKDGERLVDLDIHTENQAGEKKLVGTATIRLP